MDSQAITLPKVLRTLGTRDGLVFWIIYRMRGKQISNQQLSQLLGMSKRTVQNAIASLVKKGYVIRWLKGPHRRLAIAPGIFDRGGYFYNIDPEELRKLEKIYGPDAVAEAISVLEYTYAVSDTKPKCPIAVLRAVLRKGQLRYPPGYKRPEGLRPSSRSQLHQFMSSMKAQQRTQLLRRAYTYLISKGLSHQEALARAESVVFMWMIKHKEKAGNHLGRQPPG